MIRIGAIGYGDIAQRAHFPKLLELEEQASLVAIAGRNQERLTDCAQRFNIPKTFTDVDGMLADADIDAVLILTPPSSHGELAVKAVEAGKHVLLEKPMVKTMDEARQILASVERNPVVFLPLPYVAAAAYDTVRQLLADGVVGQVTNVECHKGHRGPTHADWFYRKDVAGGGVLFDLGVYALDGIAKIFGPAKEMSALCVTTLETRTMDDGSLVRPDVEDAALVSLRLENDIAVTINANWNSYVTHHHPRSRITIFGREGMLHVGVPGGGLYVHRADEQYDGALRDAEPVDFDGYSCRRLMPAQSSQAPQGLLEHFLHRIATGDTSTLPLRRQIHLTEIMLAAYEAAEAGHVRALETRF